MRSRSPVCRSTYMAHQPAQIPLHITKELETAATYLTDHVSAQSGYQAGQVAKAARRWADAIDKKEYVWLGVAGAATPVGLGGILADLISGGYVDAIVTTGANAYHDLHNACMLPVRHGSHNVDDNKLRKDGTTRIYTQYIHGDWTLKAQDYINQELGRRMAPRMKPPFSTATLLNELGKELLHSEFCHDPEGSFIIQAALYDVPVFLDSGSNHSLAMDFSLLVEEGLCLDTSPSQDILEAAALSVRTQPQLNVFLGEGGPRNFTQTTAPTAAEIFFLPFEGSEACIRITTADERTGGLSGSGQSEAVSWGKYKEAGKEIEVWAEYTLVFPQIAAYVSAQSTGRHHRLLDQRKSIVADYRAAIEANKPKREAFQRRLKKYLPAIVAEEKAAHERALSG